MTPLPLVGLVSLDTRFWASRATALYCQSGRIRLVWLRRLVRSLAVEARENIQSLRFVGSHCPSPPSLHQWGLTIAFLRIVSPRLSFALLRLFLACVGLRLQPYVAIADGVVLVVGVALGFAFGLVWGLA